MGPPNAVADAVIERRIYSGGFNFAKLPQDKVEQMQALALRHRVEVNATPTSLDLASRYNLRDTGRTFPKFFSELAALIQDAQGEIECVNAPDDGDVFFEFFSIKDGNLYCQRGYIVREDVHRFDYDSKPEQNMPPRQPGSARGLIHTRDDFDKPLEDFAQYQ